MTNQLPADVDALAYDIAMRSLEAEFPKHKDDPSIYRSACDGMIANLCKARGVKARNIVIKIQNTAWNTASKAGNVADPRELLRIARDEIAAMREMNKADDEKHINLGKTSPVRLPMKEKTMPRETKQTSLETSGKLTGGLFGTKSAPEPAKQQYWVSGSGSILTECDTIDDFGPFDTLEAAQEAQAKVEREEVPAPPPASEPAAEAPDNRACLNKWALFEVQRMAFWRAARDVLNIPEGQDVRSVALPILGVKDEFHIATTVFEAIAFLRDHAPATDQPDAEPDNEPAAPPVEIVEKVQGVPIVSQSTEANVIVFAKSDIYLALPDGSSLALSITLREGASFEEVQRLLDMYRQLATLPGVSVARPAAQPAPVNTPAVPGSTPKPNALTAPAPAVGGGEQISKVISGVKVSFDEKSGQKKLDLYGKYHNEWGTGPDHTCRKPEEIAAACTTINIAFDNLSVGEIVPVNPFTVTWTKGKETKPNSGRFYHDNATFARNS